MGKILQKTIISLFIGIGIFFALGVNADTFGYEVAGSSSGSLWNVLAGYRFPMGATAGSGDSMTASVSRYSSGNKWKMAVYKQSDLSLIGVTSEGEVPGSKAWNTLTFPSAPSLLASTDYFLAAWGDIDTDMLYYDSGTEDYGLFEEKTYTGTFENPWEGYTLFNRKYSIYATYTEEAAPAEEPQMQVIIVN